MNTPKKILKNDNIVKYLLFIPLILILLFLLFFPGLYDLYLSFFDVSLSNIDNANFIGLNNFIKVLQDIEFWQALSFSLKFSFIVVIIELLLGLLLALFFNSYIEKHKWLISFLLLPMMAAPALMGIMFRLLLNDFVGVIPQFVRMLGLGGISFFTSDYIFPTIILIDIIQWTSFVFVLLYAALQTIPGDIIESSKIDGCSGLKTFFYITLPYIKPILFTAGFFRFIDSFRIFDKIYVLTGGGPGNITTSITIYLYKLAFTYGDVGGSIAVSLFLLLISLIPLLFSLKFIVKEDQVIDD